MWNFGGILFNPVHQGTGLLQGINNILSVNNRTWLLAHSRCSTNTSSLLPFFPFLSNPQLHGVLSWPLGTPPDPELILFLLSQRLPLSAVILICPQPSSLSGCNCCVCYSFRSDSVCLQLSQFSFSKSFTIQVLGEKTNKVLQNTVSAKRLFSSFFN